VNADSSSLEDVLIESALIDVLKPSPATDVVDEQGREVSQLGFDIRHQLIEAFASSNIQSAPTVIRVNTNDLHIVIGGVLVDHVQLVLG
jgi:hypothetical protein